MFLYEYQAKEILARYGVPVPEGHLAETAEEAEARAREIAAESYVVKAQRLDPVGVVYLWPVSG